MTTLTRRSTLLGLGSMLGACQNTIEPIDPNDPKLTDPTTPFTADVHTHVFNAVDVQTALIFEKVLEHDHPELQVFGPLLGDLGNFAPSVKDENEALNGLEAAANSRNHGIVQAAARRLRRDRFLVAQRQILAAYRKTYGSGAPAFRARPGLASPAAESRYAVATARLQYNINLLESSTRLGHLPQQATRRVAGRGRGAAGAGSSVANAVDGAFAFMVRDFSYRYASVHEYLEEYSAGPTRKIDLMVTTYIDYDWPLGTEKPPPCTVAEQMQLAERISRLTRGWVHSNVPFCPFKQVAFNRQLITENPMKLVRDAVLSHGHIGVKFYPPMGFRPLGNADLPIDYWDDSPLVDRLKRPALGPDLDQALKMLYDFAGQYDVPLMAHTSPTMVTRDKYKTDVLDPSCWAKVTAYKPGLRINFAHFGNTDILTANGKDANARGLMALMTAGAGSPGERLYADFGVPRRYAVEQRRHGDRVRQAAHPPAGAGLRAARRAPDVWHRLGHDGDRRQGDPRLSRRFHDDVRPAGREARPQSRWRPGQPLLRPQRGRVSRPARGATDAPAARRLPSRPSAAGVDGEGRWTDGLIVRKRTEGARTATRPASGR